MKHSNLLNYKLVKKSFNREFLDLRSDTITKPTADMLNFMKNASPGDNVLGEDEDSIELENKLSKLTGMKSGLFCASGTMSNQLGIRSALKQPPYSIICDYRSHIYQYESNALSHISQALTIPVNPKSTNYLTLADILEHIRLDECDAHLAPTKLISLENTLNGSLFNIEELKKISNYCKQAKIHLHLDGARLWNASIKENIPLKRYCELFDSVSLCFSKGLGAPIGSIILGSDELIKKSKQFRKMVGGGWRQSGMLAKAVDYCLENNQPLLNKDHQRVGELAGKLQQLKLTFDYPPDTNMLFVNFKNYQISGDLVAKRLQEEGILCYSYGGCTIRLVFHYQLPHNVVDRVYIAIKKIAS
ncbi:hypothetical protein CONCODRAFT_60075 [Conidiobolus coronatus NRRL 28638]|uniref:Aromatic amino acid beta-eliminating lyase/threonine aldolase domain-containing protein n=1 Tax=Conidiobolus coronatus (strain ATCC 28846 / CBS 209.66 / NRRL 28638) TaxID=796925 RepID=A0A137P0W5_CONC2|nr:hypothetical protein CONCODRAFT_60075 [Conidiobolus coronatus NRRL 28638]|eukprot:KXN68695.1 hypothetical protein CONCODRAFT_60075 [Conidiobolus coronatus NRRL 28638]